MNRIIVTVVVMGLACSAYGAQFGDLAEIKTAELKAAVAADSIDIKPVVFENAEYSHHDQHDHCGHSAQAICAVTSAGYFAPFLISNGQQIGQGVFTHSSDCNTALAAAKQGMVCAVTSAGYFAPFLISSGQQIGQGVFTHSSDCNTNLAAAK